MLEPRHCAANCRSERAPLYRHWRRRQSNIGSYYKADNAVCSHLRNNNRSLQNNIFRAIQNDPDIPPTGQSTVTRIYSAVEMVEFYCPLGLEKAIEKPKILLPSTIRRIPIRDQTGFEMADFYCRRRLEKAIEKQKKTLLHAICRIPILDQAGPADVQRIR